MSIDLALSPEEEALQREVRAVAEQCSSGDPGTAAPLRAMSERGIWGLLVPAALGGRGSGLVSLVVACEELGRVDPWVGLAFGLFEIAGGWLPAYWGEVPEVQGVLESYLRGDGLCAFALEESPAGVEGLTRAHRFEDGDYLLRGQEVPSRGARIAARLLVVAREERAGDGALLAYVPARAAGVAVRPAALGGGGEVGLCAVDLEDVRISARDALPGERGGEALRSLCIRHKLVVAGVATGLAQALWEKALEAAASERGGGPPPAGRQAVQHALAAAHTRVEAARLVARHAAWCAENGVPDGLHAAIARCYAVEAATQAAALAARLTGARGRTATGVQPYLDAARELDTAGGCPESDKDGIAQSLGL